MNVFGMTVPRLGTRQPRWLLRAGVTFLATLMACVGLEAQQRKWIFQVGAGRVDEVTAAQDLALHDRWIEYASPESAAPVRLHALWLPHAHPEAPVLLYLHGARWDLGGSLQRMEHLHRLGFSVLGVDYRGFGKSSPVLPSERSVCEDARAAWAWLAASHPQARRYVYGHSLGGAVAIQLAAESDDVAGLMVEGTFTSLPELYSTLRWGWLSLTPAITQRFECARRVSRVRAPLLVIHGSDDELVHPDLGRALYEQGQEPKRFLLVAGGSHHDTHAVGHAQYRDVLRELFGIGPA